MEHITRQLRQFKVDAVFGKKKHYNAAERKQKCYKLTSCLQIFINAITGTTLLQLVLGGENRNTQIIALLLSIIATILSSAQKLLDYEKQAQGNSKVGDMYLEISKSTSLMLSMMADNLLTKEAIISRAEEIRNNLDQANKLGSQFSTNSSDYKKAQRGIANGEECYTEEELNLWE